MRCVECHTFKSRQKRGTSELLNAVIVVAAAAVVKSAIFLMWLKDRTFENW